MTTLLVRVRTSDLHDVLQGVKSLQGLTTQLTGQTKSLQIRDWVRLGHAAPPESGTVVMVRDRVVVPPRQEREQPTNGPQFPTIQSPGHGLLAQTADPIKSGQASP